MIVELQYKNSGLKATPSKDLKRANQALSKVLSKALVQNPHFANVKKVSMTLIVCGKTKIRSLNRKYRSIDKVTDVLSFPIHDHIRFDTKKASLKNRLLPEVELGDLVLCREKIASQAREFELTFEEEYIHLVIHGFLHLLGFDHEISPKEEKIMEEYEQKLTIDVLLQFKKLK